MSLFTRYPREELENVVSMAKMLVADLDVARPAAQRLTQFAANIKAIDAELAGIVASLSINDPDALERVIDTEAYFAARAAAANLLRLVPASCLAANDVEREIAQARIESLVSTITTVGHLDEPAPQPGDDVLGWDEDDEE